MEQPTMTMAAVGRRRSLRLWRGAWLVAAAFALLALAPAEALAQRGKQAQTQAKEHYDKAIIEYNLGHFETAIVELEAAYKLHPQPILLFNMAQAYRQLGKHERAVFFYRRYLTADPDASNKATVETRIKELETLIEQEREMANKPPVNLGDGKTTPASGSGDTGGAGDAPKDAEPPKTVTPPHVSKQPDAPPPGRRLKTAAYVTAGVGVIALGGAITFGLMAESREKDASSAPVYNPDDENAAKRFANLQWVFYGVAGAAIATAGVLYYLGARAERNATSSVALAPFVAPGQGGLLCRVDF